MSQGGPGSNTERVVDRPVIEVLGGLNIGFGLLQTALLLFLLDRPVLLVAVGGHIVAVTVVSVAAMATPQVREPSPEASLDRDAPE